MNNQITVERLKQLLRYEPSTGVFTWLVNRPPISAGAIAGQTEVWGYRVIGIDSIRYKAHRLAWLYMTGELPPSILDHKDGVRHNVWDNLRLADRSMNMQNMRRAKSTSLSGFLGVSINRKGFLAEIMVRGQRKKLGTYSTPQEAHAVYLAAKRQLHPGCTI